MRISLAISLVLFLLGCQNQSKPRKTNPPLCFDLEEIVSRGKLVALTDLSSSSYMVYKGTPIGFEYDLLRRFCDRINVSLEMQVVEDFDCIVDMIENGEGDLIAANYTITPERLHWLGFSDPILSTQQVLVQRRPTQSNEFEVQHVDNLMDLDGDTVFVRIESSFYQTLKQEAAKSACPFYIQPMVGISTEELITKVSEGTINYTVADDNIARLNKAYYPNLDVSTIISDTQTIAWATRKSSTELIDSINAWLSSFKGSRAFNAIHLKYFKARSRHKQRVVSDFSSVTGHSISPFDAIIKEQCERINWDWRLLVALIKKESNFNPSALSKRGATGLMQLLPRTGAHFGADSLEDPQQNIKAGVSYISAVIDRWEDKNLDSTNQIKFVLASYNVGVGHVMDAMQLCKKYGGNITEWTEVSYYLQKLSQPDFYNDPEVKYGYCRGIEPVNHVNQILEYWEHYKTTFN